MTLDFIWPTRYDARCFVTGPSNQDAINWLNSLHSWHSNTVLRGNRFSGKTHAGLIWSNKYSAVVISSPNDIQQLQCPIVVDNLDNFPESDVMRIFYLVSGPILWISSSKILNFELNDINTRFQAMMKITFDEPDESMFKGILQKRCMDFGLDISSECLEYLHRRTSRTYSSINSLCMKIHKLCLEEQKAPSIPLIQKVLD